MCRITETSSALAGERCEWPGRVMRFHRVAPTLLCIALGLLLAAACFFKPVKEGSATRALLLHTLKLQHDVIENQSTALRKAREALDSWSAARPNSKPAFPPIIHQIFGLFGDGSLSATMQANIQSFKQHNPNHTHILWGAQDLDVMVQRYWPAYWPVYSKLPLPVLKSDLARYMLVSTFGGAYSDIDTRCLKPVDTWADGHQNVSMIIGIEVDAHGMQDWNKIWGRELQFCQWSFAGAPGHPLLSKVIQTSIERLAAEKDVRQITDVKLVCGLTGPYLFTDVVYEYLKQQGYDWRRLLGYNQEEQVGDMYILSITGFSPGVGHMGAGGIYSPRAKVKHLFNGAWKPDQHQHQHDDHDNSNLSDELMWHQTDAEADALDDHDGSTPRLGHGLFLGGFHTNT